MSEPVEQDELSTLMAELRSAEQHRRAAYERMREMQRDLDALMRRARDLLARIRS